MAGWFEARHPRKIYGSPQLVVPDNTRLNGRDWDVAEAEIHDETRKVAKTQPRFCNCRRVLERQAGSPLSDTIGHTEVVRSVEISFPSFPHYGFGH